MKPETQPRFLWLWAGLLLLSSLLLGGCGGSATPDNIQGASINGVLDKSAAGEDFPFLVSVAQARDPIGVDFRANLQEGRLTVQLLTPEGAPVWQATATAGEPFKVNTVVRPEQSGTYRLGLRWEGPVKGSYSLQWRPGEVPVASVQPIALLSGLGMMIVAAGFLVYALVQGAGWRYLGGGALGWIGSVALKFAWAVPFNGPVYQFLTKTLPGTVGQLLFYLYVGALTGIFEVALVWVVLRSTRLGKAAWNQALGFGIAFGAIEALFLGLSSFTNVLLALLNPDLFNPYQLEQLALLNNLLYGLAPIWERFFTILVHAGANVALFYALARRQPRWFWAAFIFKTLIDTWAAFGQFWGVDTLGKIWVLESLVAVFGLLGWWMLRTFQVRYPQPEPEAPSEA